MNMVECLNPGGSPRRAHLERRTRCSFLKIRRIKDESGLWKRRLADALCLRFSLGGHSLSSQEGNTP